LVDEEQRCRESREYQTNQAYYILGDSTEKSVNIYAQLLLTGICLEKIKYTLMSVSLMWILYS